MPGALPTTSPGSSSPSSAKGRAARNDYIELSRIFHAVLIGNVPRFEAAAEDAARRFISLVDEFYDRNVKLVMSAAAAPEELYRGERLRFEFERTASRLLEMQSHEYLARTPQAVNGDPVASPCRCPCKAPDPPLPSALPKSRTRP